VRNAECFINPIGIYPSFLHFWHFSSHLTCLNSFFLLLAFGLPFFASQGHSRLPARIAQGLTCLHVAPGSKSLPTTHYAPIVYSFSNAREFVLCIWLVVYLIILFFAFWYRFSLPRSMATFKCSHHQPCCAHKMLKVIVALPNSVLSFKFCFPALPPGSRLA